MKRLFTYILTVVTLLSCCFPAFAGNDGSYARGIDPKADSVSVARMKQKMREIRRYRPTVALVLSGGGAKGAAHVGVIRYIEKLGIPVDMVLGTSIGGLVGGLYSLGYTTDQIDSLFRNMDWGWAFSDKLSREYI